MPCNGQQADMMMVLIENAFDISQSSRACRALQRTGFTSR